MKKMIKVDVVGPDDDWIPEDEVGFFKFWNNWLDVIPDEYRDSANIEIDACEDYGSPRLEMSISYKRLETDEEEAIRERRELATAEQARERELIMLAKLKRKHEGEQS